MQYGLSLVDLKKKKKTGSFKHHHIFPVSTAEPTAITYLYRNLLIAKNCMVDGRLHEFCLFKLWINYNTVASFEKTKKQKKTEKETLAFICTEAYHSEVVVRRVLCWIS